MRKTSFYISTGTGKRIYQVLLEFYFLNFWVEIFQRFELRNFGLRYFAFTENTAGKVIPFGECARSMALFMYSLLLLSFLDIDLHCLLPFLKPAFVNFLLAFY